MSNQDDNQSPRPMLRIVRGDPDDAELAAITAVFAATAAAAVPDSKSKQPTRRSLWADPAVHMRRPRRPGPGAWQASVHPHQ